MEYGEQVSIEGFRGSIHTSIKDAFYFCQGTRFISVKERVIPWRRKVGSAPQDMPQELSTPLSRF